MLSDSDFRFALQQIEGRQRTRDKLPTFAAIDGWLYPPRLNLEQCSSERTARFKASLLSTLNSQLSTLYHPGFVRWLSDSLRWTELRVA